MSRLFLAFACFFRVLFGQKLPAGALALLPETTTPVSQSTPKPGDAKPIPKPAEPAKPADAKPAKPEPRPDQKPADKSADGKPRVSTAQHHRDGALALLALLQREGRLVDFLQ